MSVTIHLADKRDTLTMADLIEEIERFYGSTQIQPLAQRQSQIEEALFGSPPMASALLVEDETGGLAGLATYSFLSAAGSSHSLFLKELSTSATPCANKASAHSSCGSSRTSPPHVPDAAVWIG
ncbi:hypothetical protein ACFXDF_00285 [Streptomyces sp. NPDC059426]|uniref:hypothetical protein n=1 Tax=unclassified Streptomyces TaxID=2593676 RepID=UPI0036B1BFFA